VFALNQKYPNPFNPLTTFSYELPEQAYVNITIYDLLGRQIITLVNQTQGPGYKSIIWDANNVSSGIYLPHYGRRFHPNQEDGVAKIVLKQ